MTVVPGPVHHLVVDRGSLDYVAEDGIHQIAEDTGRVRRVASVAGVRDLAVDARHLYWITSSGDLDRAPRPD
ncbi:MAG TPA: hypothetical protein VM734_23125 [Kofleriaceae bacterium]|nr:hypothetical protein [Kofleriaceae bacterium]